ncbi:MAG: Transposase family protein [Mucilaginibacter sp.]|jgi:transposase|nr:Transposase family protein [Mucilaginibacter sp.]
MKYHFFIGIDVSKSTLDFTLLADKEKQFQLQTSNDLTGIKQFWTQLKAQTAFTLDRAVFCMEHTGIYNQHLLTFLYSKKAAICLESAVHIKRSAGLQRGKNDQVDAFRIAQYAYKNRETLRLWQPKRQVIIQLKELAALRSRLLNAKKQLSVPIKETALFDKILAKQTLKLCKATADALNDDLKKVEAAIDQLVVNDDHLKRLFDIVTSVQGIGKITATAMIVCTNEFKDINEPAKFACYSGIAPFEHSSGSSIRGRSRVSHQANKPMKTLLHLAAMVAICYNPDMNAFYQRKVAQNKNKMSVINAVRNKLIHRVFACVNDDRLYQKNYQQTFV